MFFPAEKDHGWEESVRKFCNPAREAVQVVLVACELFKIIAGENIDGVCIVSGEFRLETAGIMVRDIPSILIEDEAKWLIKLKNHEIEAAASTLREAALPSMSVGFSWMITGDICMPASGGRPAAFIGRHCRLLLFWL